MKCSYALGLVVSVVLGHSAYAQDYSARGNAQWMLERVTGVKWPADSAILDQMAQKISAGDKAGAVDLALQQPQFLNVTMKQLALQLSTREESVLAQLNDFTAAFMGVARDDMDARELLYGNFYYKADPAKVTLSATNLGQDILNSNNHYRELASKANVDVASVLQKVDGQMLIAAFDSNGNITSIVPNPDPAGVLTSRSFLGAHSIAGTNRRLVEYSFREFMCVKMPEWSDTSASDIRIGRDISRSPGGDTMKFQSSCKGCHTQLDSFRGAFAKWDFQGSFDGGYNGYVGVAPGGSTYTDPATGNKVALKLNRPTFIEYAGGYVTKDDSWINNSRGAANSVKFGWSGSVTGGNGTNSFGRLLANSARFSQCMSKRVWASVCKYELSSDEADTLYVSLGLAWASGGYKFKDLFKLVAAHPKCRQ